MADKPMTVTKCDTVTLTPRAESKFASVKTPGRVLNVRAETDGTGTSKIQLVHPDGKIEDLASVAIPLLAKDEKCILQCRVSTGVATGISAEAAVAEIG